MDATVALKATEQFVGDNGAPIGCNVTLPAAVKGGLFPILLFPVTLPVFLPAIRLTEIALTGAPVDSSLLVVMSAFDAILILAASILYDYL